MQVGSLGATVFEVSDRLVRTFAEFSESFGGRIATHEVALARPIGEFVGPAARKVSIPITLNRQLGVSPIDDIAVLQEAAETGRLLPLTIAGRVIGGPGALWSIEQADVNHRAFDARGDSIISDVSLSLALMRTADTPAALSSTVAKSGVTRER